MNAITETEVVQACQKLFGDNIDISKDFLYTYIQPSGVKSAYRRKAKENHPDLFAADPVHIQQKQTVLFREILQAYDVLNLFFKQREFGVLKTTLRPASPGGQKQDHKRETATQNAADKRATDGYYRGNVPRRTLQIGQFLYYRGKISFNALISALLWQRKQRPSIGDIALHWGMLDREGVNRIFNSCGKPRLFGEKAVELGLLTVFQVNTILLYQRSQQHRLGSYFIENGILTGEALELLVRELKEHNAAVLSANRHARHSSVSA